MESKKLKYLLNNQIEKILSKFDIKYEIIGDNIYSTCPIHQSSDNPRAFSFCKKRGIWKCWTRDCQQEFKNDVFGLIQGILSQKSATKCDFSDVNSWILKEFNLSVNNDQESTDQDYEDEFSKLIRILNEKLDHPQNNHVQLNLKIEVPSKYFLKRGFKKQTLEYFGVGDCADSSSKLYHRSIIPIHNDDGSNVVGYIGRSTKDYKLPKFLIYPKGFDKRYYLYNLHRAMPYILKTNTILIVEGQGDVWKLHEAGINNVVGMFGKTLSKEQQLKLQKLPLTNLIILTDNDQAGRESKIQLQRQLGRFYKLTFPRLTHKDVGDMTIQQIQNDILSQITNKGAI